jgi:hypothetical protein
VCVRGGSEHAGSDDDLHGPLFTPASSEVGSDHGLTEAHTSQLNPNPRLLTELDSDRNMMAAHRSPPHPLSPTEFDRDHGVHPPPLYASSSTEFYSDDGSVVHPPSPGSGSPSEPEYEVALHGVPAFLISESSRVQHIVL